MLKMLRQLWTDQDGQGLIEYVFILILISLSVLVVLKNIGQSILPKLQSIEDAL